MSYPYHDSGGGGGQYASSNNYGSYDQSSPQEWGSYPNRQQGNLYPPDRQQQSASTDSFDDASPLGKYGAAPASSPGFQGGYYDSDLPVLPADRVVREKGNPYASNASGGNKAKRWIVAAVIAVIVVGAGVGIAVWKVESNKNKSSSSSSSSSSGGSSNGLEVIPGTAGVVKSNPSDPSDFETDSRFSRSFVGMTYTPYLAQEPQCGATLANVTEDIQILSQLTTRLRTYGSACNISQLILDAIARTQVNMTVYLGSYIGTNETVNTQQLQWQIDAMTLFGTSHVAGIVVGNEYILDSTNTKTATTYIVDKIATMKTLMATAGFGSVPVGTGDAGSEITAALCKGSDFVMCNDHALENASFGGVPVAQAAGWTWEFFEDNDQNLASAASIPAYIGETGWPTNSMTAANLTYEGATAGIPELQTFLDTYVCTANTNGTAYYWFSPFDEHWKEMYGGVEPYWGLFTQDKVLKSGITLPNCTIT